ncbi:MAG: hypothetical protein QOC58_2186 [Mycobacterium sp.]|nr:hypothetical protein [Mycobacterium sp.]
MNPIFHEMIRAASKPATRQALRYRAEAIPRLALPTVGGYLSALTVFILSTIAGIAGWVWIWGTIAVNTTVIFAMFPVVHEAVHYLISSKRWVKVLVGRLAWVVRHAAQRLPGVSIHPHRAPQIRKRRR